MAEESLRACHDGVGRGCFRNLKFVNLGSFNLLWLNSLYNYICCNGLIYRAEGAETCLLGFGGQGLGEDASADRVPL